MNTKKKIVNKLNEYGGEKKHVVMDTEKYKEMGDELDDDTVVKIVDEDDAAGRGVEHGINPEAGEDEYLERKKLSQSNPNVKEDESGEVNQEKLRADVQKFITKLGSSQFGSILAKIDQPIEKVEMIAAFAELLKIDSSILPKVIRRIRDGANTELGVQQEVPVESTRPRMKKSDLVEHVLKNKR